MEEHDYIPYKLLRVHWKNAVLKLLRRTLILEDKEAEQSLLQNAEGLHVNTSKLNRTNTNALLQYIIRYMKRGPITLKWNFLKTSGCD